MLALADQPNRRVAGSNSIPPSPGSSVGAAAGSVARSAGGVAGGVTGSLSQPPHGPKTDAVSNVATEKRVISSVEAAEPLVAPRRPAPRLDERGFELEHCGSLAEHLVVGIDTPACGTFAGWLVRLVVGFALVVHGGHLLPHPIEQASCQPPKACAEPGR